MNRSILLTAFTIFFGSMVGTVPVGAAPGGGGTGDQPWDPCPPKTRSAPPYKDSDGLSDCAEINIYGTLTYKTDSDLDGLIDGQEVTVYGTDPALNDTDGDKFGSDGQEIEDYGTDPLTPDTDADGDKYSDGAELTIGLDPNNPDTDGDGVLDWWDTYCRDKMGHKYGKGLSSEFDGDGLGDYYEANVSGTNGCKPDTDGDGYSDGEEVNSGTDPTDAASFP